MRNLRLHESNGFEKFALTAQDCTPAKKLMERVRIHGHCYLAFAMSRVHMRSRALTPYLFSS
jgi:hypothetical protein